MEYIRVYTATPRQNHGAAVIFSYSLRFAIGERRKEGMPRRAPRAYTLGFATLSMATAMAPSPVTLQAVPKESMAM